NVQIAFSCMKNGGAPASRRFRVSPRGTVAGILQICFGQPTTESRLGENLTSRCIAREVRVLGSTVRASGRTPISTRNDELSALGPNTSALRLFAASATTSGRPDPSLSIAPAEKKKSAMTGLR